MEYLIDLGFGDSPASAVIGLERGKVRFTPLAELPSLIEPGVHRPHRQTWMALRPLAQVMGGLGEQK